MTQEKTLMAIRMFNGAPGMISLEKDEEVVEVMPADGGWTVVRKKNGAEGPVLTEVLSKIFFFFLNQV